jgi:hypothetical protein
MRATLSILAGLVLGVAVAGLALVGILALAPDPVASSSPAPSLVTESATPAASPSPAPVVSAAPSASALDAPFQFWVDAEGIVRHGTVGGIGPDVMVEGLESIMPGVDVPL